MFLLLLFFALFLSCNIVLRVMVLLFSTVMYAPLFFGRVLYTFLLLTVVAVFLPLSLLLLLLLLF